MNKKIEKIINSNIKSREDFINIINILDLKIGCEIGVRLGNYSKFLLENTNLEILYSIDPWSPKYLEYGHAEGDGGESITRKILEKFNERSLIVKEPSFEAVKKFGNNFFDFIYIDAAHDYKSVKDDINLFYPKLKVGGIMSGHDYLEYPDYGVVGAVDEFIKEYNLKLFITGITDKGFSVENGEEAQSPSWITYKK